MMMSVGSQVPKPDEEMAQASATLEATEKVLLAQGVEEADAKRLAEALFSEQENKKQKRDEPPPAGGGAM